MTTKKDTAGDATKSTAWILLRFFFAVILAFSFVGAICSRFIPTSRVGPGPSPTDTPAPPPGSVEISIYSSDTKQDWLDAVVARFNAAPPKTGAGHPAFARVYHVKSGASMQDILDGTIQPSAWSPGEESWVENLNQQWIDLHDQTLIPEACRPTVYAPVGFAMFRPMAEALGWPDKPIGWDTIVDLAADPQGWAKAGHPEWGAFKFGHTHPAQSNSGLLMLTSFAYAALDRTDGLTADLVKSKPVMDAMRTVELNTYHYGISSRDNISRMVQQGPAYLHATNATEAEVLRANSGAYGELRFPLAFIFPAEGAFWADHPYCVLDAAWSTDEQQEAARLFGDYLLQAEQQELAVTNYLRPVDEAVALHAPFTLANGTDPSITSATVPALGSPSPEVAGAVQDVFLQTKKKATIVIMLDKSGSMSGEKMESARAATADFIDRLERDDEVYAYTFGGYILSDDGVMLIPYGRAGEVKEALEQVVRGIYAGGGTALYDAVCIAVKQGAVLQADDGAAGEKRLYGVVLLSDGQDTASGISQEEMFACLLQSEGGEGVKVFTIAYGDDADRELLGQIAERSGGKAFTGDPDTIEDVYLRISAEQ